MADIVSGAGTTKGALYFHFASKDELAQFIIAEQHRLSIESVQALLATSGLQQALYVGDDLTDEDVFRLKQPGLFTVHVDEGSETIDSAAQWRLHGQPEVERLLDWLVTALRPQSGTAADRERR